MSVKVKICGIRNIENAHVAVESGADFLGFIFVPGSKRFIDPSLAKPIIDAFRKKVKIVGVFKNQSTDEVNQISKQLDLDYAQIHGEENPEYCKQINTKVIKAFPLRADFVLSKTLTKMKKYEADYYLLDREKQGEGEMLDLKNVEIISKELPVIFAGGLTPGNVLDVIMSVRPIGVDVISGIETDGEPDSEKIREFVRRAKEVSL